MPGIGFIVNKNLEFSNHIEIDIFEKTNGFIVKNHVFRQMVYSIRSNNQPFYRIYYTNR